jgi:prolyl 4-hydroxylase
MQNRNIRIQLRQRNSFSDTMGNLQLCIYLVLVPSGASYSRHALAFAGGFGAKSAKSDKKAGREKVKRRNLSEFVVSQPPKPPGDDKPPKLDKWGLPVPTQDDLFPPMLPGAEIVPAPIDHDKVSLQMIKDALANHLKLDLTRFDDRGVEQDPLPDRQAMKLRLLHTSPPVIAIDNFLTESECQEIKDITIPTGTQPCIEAMQVDSATFSALATSIRTSTSWFCHYAQVPTLITKAVHVLGIPLRQMEEPQIVRYRPGEEFSWHYDEIPRNQLENGGQRVATLLVYLNDVDRGGGTIFRDLKQADGSELTVKPRMGSSMLFFPAFADGNVDDRTLHKGEVALDTKWICQMWIHQKNYTPATPPGNTHDAALPAIQNVANLLRYNSDFDL